MSLLEKKMDAMAQVCLAETLADRKAAMDQLRELLQEKQTASVDTLAKQIHMVLRELGVPTGIMGHKYLVDAIRLAVENPDSVRHLTKEGGTYVVVAEMNGTTPMRAERAIRHGIEEGLRRTDYDAVQKYFGGTVHPDKGKPTNREYITALAQHLRLQNAEV